MLGKNKTATLLAVIILVGAVTAWAAPTFVNRLELTRDGSFTVLTISGSDQLRYAHQSVAAKEGKPFRIVIDCLAARHGLSQKQFTELPGSVIEAIRTSQFAVTPEEVVRVVLDLKEESVYRVESGENSIRVMVSDQKTAPFDKWASNAAKNPELASSVSRTKKNTPQTAVKTNPTVNENRPRKPSVVTRSEKKDTPAEKSPLDFVKLPAPEEPVNYGPVVTQQATEKNNQLTAKPSVVKNDKTEVAAKPRTQQPKATPSVAKTKTQPTARPSAVKNNKTEVASKPQAQPPKTKPVVEKTKSQPATHARFNLPGTVQEKPLIPYANQQPVISRNDLARNAEEKAVLFASLEPRFNNVPEPGMATDESGPNKKDVHQSPPTGKQEPAKAKPGDPHPAANKPAPSVPAESPVMASIDNNENVSAPSGQKEAKKVSEIRTSKYRRESAKSAELKATKVVQFPSRMVIKYKRTNPRDPFHSLISDDDRKKGNVDLSRVPNVETLYLVGILEPKSGRGAALMEDMDGIGYILRAGDRVQNGYVAQIDKNAIYFQINEYGWGRTVVKNMEKEK